MKIFLKIFTFSLSLVIANFAVAADELKLEIFVSEPEEINITSALIMGPTEMMVVSAQGTRSSANRLADLIAEKGLRLKYIYLTHAHLDHSQGATMLLQRFPNAQFITTPEIGELQRSSIEGYDAFASFRYQENAAVPSTPVTDYHEDTIEIDGHPIEIWKDVLGDSGPDVPHSALYIPSLKALMPSDTIYYNGHVMLAGSTTESRVQAIEQIDSWLAMDLDVVVPGHTPRKSLSKLTARGALEHTKNYIIRYEEALATSSSSDEVISKMIAAYPTMAHQSALYISVYRSFGENERLQDYYLQWSQDNGYQ